jgi:hypothetical protein
MGRAKKIESSPGQWEPQVGKCSFSGPQIFFFFGYNTRLFAVIPEDQSLKKHCCGNLKLHVHSLVFPNAHLCFFFNGNAFLLYILQGVGYQFHVCAMV